MIKKMTFRKILFSNKTNNRIVTIEKMKPVLCANMSLKTRFLIDFFSYFFPIFNIIIVFNLKQYSMLFFRFVINNGNKFAKCNILYGILGVFISSLRCI